MHQLTVWVLVSTFVHALKKILAISVAIMYLAITSGLVLQIHYCMGRQSGASVAISADADHTCGKCGMTNGKNKCCHDEVKFIKLQDAHKQVTADFEIAAPAVTGSEFNLINASQPSCCQAATPASHSPPEDGIEQLPLFIRYSVFRI